MFVFLGMCLVVLQNLVEKVNAKKIDLTPELWQTGND